MGIGWQIFFFVLLILLLSLLRTRLVYEFAASSVLLFGHKTPGIWLYSLIFLPGTIIHELSHWLVAELLGVRTGEISILPDLSGDATERLGSVQTAAAGPLRSFAIGIAPFITGLGILWLLGYFLLLGGASWWQSGLLVYGVVVVGSSMLLSPEDRRTWLPTSLFFTFVILLIYKFGYLDSLSRLLLSPLTQINRMLLALAAISFAVISLSYGFRRIIELVTGKKIARR